MTFVHAGVIRTLPTDPLEVRLLAVSRGISALLTEFAPDAIAVERVFAQHNLRTVMGTAQASGIALSLAADRGLTVGLHTPSEVKAAITGYGSAAKQQLSWDLVTLDKGWHPDKRFQQVTTRGGAKGYVATDKLRSMLDYRLLANRKGEIWQITAFVAGD